MTCHPLITHRAGTWQAWCKPCRWDGPERAWQWQARRDLEQHQGEEEQ